jgi:hypothetical protein
VAVVCFGWAARALHLKLASPVAGLLERWFDLNAVNLARADNIAAYALAGAGALTLIRPCWFVLLPAGVWITLAAVGVAMQSSAYEPLVGLEFAASAIAPLALIFIDFWPPKFKFSLGMHNTGLWLLRIAASVAFISQGVLALIQSQFGGPWIDVMAQALDNVLPRELDERDVRFALAWLGAIDIAVGFAFLIRRSRIAALSAVAWGVAAAGFFTIASGEKNYAETLIRFGLIGAPATLLCHWWLALVEEPPTIAARNEFR